MTLFTLFVAAFTSVAGLGAAPDADRKERAAGLVFSVPRDAMVTSQASAKDVETVAVSWGEEVVLITLYSGDKRPKPRRAYEVHREELERRVKGDGRIFQKDFSWKMLGKRRRGAELRYQLQGRWLITHLLAAKSHKRTVVAVWTRPVGSGDSFAAQLLKNMRFE